MRKKRIMLVALTVMLFLPSFLVDAASSSSTKKTEPVITDGAIAEKDEVVYATLTADGQLNEIYVVNILDVVREGFVTDFGPYNTVKNLTDLSEIVVQDQTIKINAPKGKFYYQGNMDKSHELPWEIQISYVLNGVETSPEELVGKDGSLQIDIKTTANKNVDSTFYENFLLQIGFVVTPDVFTNIEAPNAMIANVGKNRRVNFTVMPEQDGEFFLKADVVDFEMDGIEISAVPASMGLDVEVEGFTDDMKTLADAIAEVHNGVSELKKGVSTFNSGVKTLRDGSAQYEDGMNEISKASTDLENGSETIKDSLALISQSFSGGINNNDFDLSELKVLSDNLGQLSVGINMVANELNTLDGNYSDALSALDTVISNVPRHNISEKQIEELYNSDANKEVINQLIETYYASNATVKVYDNVKEVFQIVDGSLNEMVLAMREWSYSLQMMSNGLDEAMENMDMLSSLSQLEKSLADISKGYHDFHAGLLDYTGGISQLASSYKEIHTGITEVSNGTEELFTGVEELEKGTKELSEETSDLPMQLQSEMDKMLAEYDKSDYEPISFVSAENTNINSVQFVMKTESMKKDEEDNKVEVEQEKKGFWAKILQLFGRN